MTSIWTQNALLVTGAARLSDLLYLAVRERELDAKDASHTIFVSHYQDKKYVQGNVDWDALSMVVVSRPAARMIAMSGDGEVFTFVGGQVGAESIEPVSVGLRSLGVIDGYAYACGMKRQVFKRVDEGQWKAMHAPAPKTKGTVLGFEGIAGFDASNIYAAGWGGEIWRFDGAKWHAISSPTNQILTAVACGEDGDVYACGKQGTLLKGRKDTWEVLDLGGMTDDLWDVHWFNSRLFASSLSRIYEWDGKELRVAKMGDDFPRTCFKLTSAEGVLWSVGTDDIFSFDGKQWRRRG